MQQIALFALLGLGTGALIAGIALGLVITYRGAGVINLASGAMAMVAAFLFWALRTGHFGFTLGVVPAIVVALALMMVVSLLVELVTFRPLRTASPLAKLVSTLGVLLFSQAVIQISFGSAPVTAPPVLPSGTITAFGVPTQIANLYLAGIVVALAIALTVLYRFTRFGLATRAASESEPFALLAGLPPNELSLMNTMLSNLVVGLIGICAGSLASIDSTSLPLLIVPALAAALFARFTSFPIAAVAGLLVGASESILYYLSTLAWFPKDNGQALPGIQQLLEFILVVLALWWRGSRLPRRGEFVERSLPPVPRQERLMRRMGPPVIACVIALIVLPWDFRQGVITGLVVTELCLSLTVITGYVGQLSVVQLALSGVAGFVVSHLAAGSGIGFPFGALIAVAAAAAVGLVVGVSALRVRGVSLVVVTLAAAEAIQSFGFGNSSWGGGLNGASVPEPHLFGFDFGPFGSFRGLDGKLPSPTFGFVVLLITALTYLAVVNLRRSALGRRMLAVRSNERAAAAANVNVTAIKLTAFLIGSTIAGIAGVMYAYDFGSVSSSRFDAIAALVLIANVYVTGITMPQGAVLAGFAATGAVMPLVLQKWVLPSSNIGVITALIGGAGLLIQLNVFPEGITGAMWKKQHKEQQQGRRRRFKLAPGVTNNPAPPPRDALPPLEPLRVTARPETRR